MAARASLSLDDGMRTLSWLAVAPLRRRVSMSAIGSVIVIGGLLSPAGLGHAGNLAGVHHLPKADPAQVELAVHGARSPATSAAGVGPHLELRLALLLLDERCLGHETPQVPLLRGVGTSEREAEGVEQSPTLGVGAGGRDDGDVHATNGVDLVVLDLREDQLLVDPEGVVAPAVEAVGRQAPEVPDPGNGEGDQAVEELPHAVGPQGDFGPDGHALAQLEGGNGATGPGDEG